jgi:hypothetical protein
MSTDRANYATESRNSRRVRTKRFVRVDKCDDLRSTLQSEKKIEWVRESADACAYARCGQMNKRDPESIRGRCKAGPMITSKNI